MTLPKEIKDASQIALAAMKKHPKNYLSSPARSELMSVFFELGSPIADTARKFLAVITAKRVLPLYQAPNPDKYGIKSSSNYMLEHRTATYQIELAEKAIHNTHPTEDTYRIACDLHYSRANYMPLRSMFADIAANRCLVEASAPNAQWLYQHEHSDEEEGRFQVSHNFETASTAAFAISYYVDANEVDPESFPDAWNWWIEKTPIDTAKMQEFWE